MDVKKKLAEGVWRSDVYYQMAKQGSLDMDHPGMQILKQLTQKANRILDLGCGEGSRLNALSKGKTEAIGIDISETAIRFAKKNYPKLQFIKDDLENIPLKDEEFDLIYSAYVIEHLSHPGKVLSEAVRLLAGGGFLVLIAPNYGAPNRCSPPFRGSRIEKLFLGLINDFLHYSDDIENWVRVKPLTDSYFIDSDTTVEPYIRSLMTCLVDKGLEIKQFTSCWSEELKNAKLHQIMFGFLGRLRLYPFLMWGPHLVVVAMKRKYEK